MDNNPFLAAHQRLYPPAETKAPTQTAESIAVIEVESPPNAPLAKASPPLWQRPAVIVAAVAVASLAAVGIGMAVARRRQLPPPRTSIKRR